MGGPTRPTPGVPFVSRRKEPKACRGCRPWTPLGGIIIPPQRRCRSPQKGFQPQQKTDLPLWIYGQIGPVFSSGFIEGTLSIFNSWLGRWVASEGYRKFYTLATNTARAQGRGIKGGYAPFAGGPGTRRSLAYLSQHLCCYFPLREKVGRGGGAERPKRWQQGLPAGAASRGCQQGLPAPQNPSRGRQGEKKRGS